MPKDSDKDATSLTVSDTVELMRSSGWLAVVSSPEVRKLVFERTGQTVILVGEDDSRISGEPLKRLLQKVEASHTD